MSRIYEHSQAHRLLPPSLTVGPNRTRFTLTLVLLPNGDLAPRAWRCQMALRRRPLPGPMRTFTPDPRQLKILKGHRPRVIYHHICLSIRRLTNGALQAFSPRRQRRLAAHSSRYTHARPFQSQLCVCPTLGRVFSTPMCVSITHAGVSSGWQPTPLGIPNQGPSRVLPGFLFEKICSFLEPFCGNLSTKRVCSSLLRVCLEEHSSRYVLQHVGVSSGRA